MDLATGALLFVGAFNLLLAAIILVHAPHTRANICYALLVLWLVVWIVAILVLRLSRSQQLQYAALATSYTSGLGIALSFWYFAAFFTRRRIHFLVHSVLFAGAAVVAWLVWTSPDFVRGVTRLPSGQVALAIGPYGWVFIAYFAAVMLDAFRSLTAKYLASAGSERAQLFAILLGTMLSTVIGASFNVFLVQAGTAAYIGWGPVSTIVMVAFIAYAIVRHHLMSIHLVTAELFTFGLILSLLVNVLVSPNAISRLVEAVTLQLAIGFGTYVIRAALREAKEREGNRHAPEHRGPARSQLRE